MLLFNFQFDQIQPKHRKNNINISSLHPLLDTFYNGCNILNLVIDHKVFSVF